MSRASRRRKHFAMTSSCVASIATSASSRREALASRSVSSRSVGESLTIRPATTAMLTPMRAKVNARLPRMPRRGVSGAFAAYSSMTKDTLQDPQCSQQRDEGAAALAHKRQRHACHWNEPDVYADVHEHLKEDKHHDAHRNQPSERVLGVAGDAEATEQHQDEE